MEPRKWNQENGTKKMEPRKWNQENGTKKMEPLGNSFLDYSFIYIKFLLFSTTRFHIVGRTKKMEPFSDSLI